MKTKEKLDRAGWTPRFNSRILELYTRGESKVLYDVVNDMILVWEHNGVRTKYPDAVQMDIIFER